MKIKNGYVLKEMKGALNTVSIVVAVGEASKNLNGYLTLNETGLVVWNTLKKGATEEDVISALLNEYDVSYEVAKQDVDNVIKTLKSIGAIDD